MDDVDSNSAPFLVTDSPDLSPPPEPWADVVALRDDSTFESFYRSEYRPLLRIAWAMTGRRDLGEDLVQDVMIKVHQRWSKVSRYERPGAFARRVLLNDATSWIRRRTTERRATERLPNVHSVPAVEPPPDETLWSALRSLPTRQAQAVALHYLDDLSTADIAQVLDIAPNTVKVHLHRGRAALAAALATEEEDR